MKTTEGQVSKDLETTSDFPHSLHVEAPSGAGNVCMSPTTPYQKAVAANSSGFEDVKAGDTCENVQHSGDGEEMECVQGDILHHLLSLCIFLVHALATMTSHAIVLNIKGTSHR